MAAGETLAAVGQTVTGADAADQARAAREVVGTIATGEFLAHLQQAKGNFLREREWI